MSYHGDIRLEDTIDLKFTTRSFTTGAPTALTSGVISAYIGNGTTQLTAGITLTTDFDSVTGLNNVRVAATAANGYSNATNIDLVITTGTVGGVSVVGEVVGSFSIGCRSALMPATAARTLVVDAAGLADVNVVKLGPTGSGTAQTARDIGASVLLSSGVGAGQLNFASGVVNANVIKVAGTDQTAGDLQASLNTIDNFLDTEVAAILSDTNAILIDTAEIGAAGAGLTALATQTSVTTIDDFLDTEIAAIKAKTDNLPTDPADASDVAAGLAALNDVSAAEVNAEVVDALATDTYAEPTGVPGATVALSAKVGFMYMALRNGLTVTSTKKQFLDDGGAAEWEKDLSDDGTTYTESEGNVP